MYYNREGLGIDVDLSLPSLRVIRSLEQIIEWRGKYPTNTQDLPGFTRLRFTLHGAHRG